MVAEKVQEMKNDFIYDFLNFLNQMGQIIANIRVEMSIGAIVPPSLRV